MSNILRRATVSATSGGGVSGGFTPEYVESTHEFVSAGDTNGIIYYHGTKYDTAAWTNPLSSGFMPWTGGWAESHFSNSSFGSLSNGMAARRLDLMPGEAASITVLSLHQYSGTSDRTIEFVFEGSNNRNSWEVIVSGTLTTANTWQTFESADANFYSYFRLRDANSATVARIGGIELYGTLRRRMNDALVFKEFLDTRDFFYLIGSRNSIGSWDNPALNTAVLNATQLTNTDRTLTNPTTSTTARTWLFGEGISFKPSAVSLRNYTGSTGQINTGFKIEASLDGGSNWTPLYTHESGELGLPKAWNLFNIDSANSYNGIRITTPDSRRLDEIQLYCSQYEVPIYDDGGNTFDAAAIPNLAAWYDATDITLGNAQRVTTWADRSGNGFDLTAPDNEALQPTFIQSSRAVRFAGQFMSASQPNVPLASSEDTTIFIVGYKTNNSSSRNVLVSSRALNGGDNGITWAWENSTNNTRMRSFRAGVSGKDTGSNGFLVPSGIHVWHMRISALLTNWGHDGTVDYSFDSMGLPSTTGKMYIGAEFSSTETGLLNGVVKEVILYRRYLDDSEITAISSALKNKWGI